MRYIDYVSEDDDPRQLWDIVNDIENISLQIIHEWFLFVARELSTYCY